MIRILLDLEEQYFLWYNTQNTMDWDMLRMDYITVKEAGEKWGVSSRAVTYHIIEGRISGAVKKGNLWLIPASTPQPEDRRKRGKSNRPQKRGNV